ncbi:hypothetical protein HDK90DRAFT_119963 [Phyllosticta capitalensis]|uniref:Uncharacterized protein n=1 Tax=Phyllosticta capitalensis TaxID=121624 RepID=A0ABR1Y9E7_9PEZI
MSWSRSAIKIMRRLNFRVDGTSIGARRSDRAVLKPESGSSFNFSSLSSVEERHRRNSAAFRHLLFCGHIQSSSDGEHFFAGLGYAGLGYAGHGPHFLLSAMPKMPKPSWTELYDMIEWISPDVLTVRSRRSVKSASWKWSAHCHGQNVR